MMGRGQMYLNGLNAISGLGYSEQEAVASLQANASSYWQKLTGFLPHAQQAPLLELTKIPYDTHIARNNLFAQYCIDAMQPLLNEAIAKYGAHRIGIVVGTSTQLIRDIEVFNSFEATTQTLHYDPKIYKIGAISDFIREHYQLQGPSYTIATACSSAGRALISAANLIEAGLCDAVIAGGTDTLSAVTVGGFHALSALSLQPVLPFHKDRCGINIGEGAGFTLVCKEKLEEQPLKLLGFGATSDAYHASAPEPTASSPIVAVKQALAMANLAPADIGYVNMHGTGTKLNDAMEANIIRQVFQGEKVAISSTKHITGHTLGAAAIVEAYIAKLILQYHLDLPYHPYHKEDWQEEFGDLNLVTTSGQQCTSPYILSNSFAFGGNNVSLVLGF